EHFADIGEYLLALCLEVPCADQFVVACHRHLPGDKCELLGANPRDLHEGRAWRVHTFRVEESRHWHRPRPSSARMFQPCYFRIANVFPELQSLSNATGFLSSLASRDQLGRGARTGSAAVPVGLRLPPPTLLAYDLAIEIDGAAADNGSHRLSP